MQHQQAIDPTCLGPLSQLVGSWEGDSGHDDYSSTTTTPVETRYRESTTFEPVGPIRNGSRELYGLRYTTNAWPAGEEYPFHQELGYWLWSPKDQQIVRCFTNEHGVTIHAGGHCEDDSHHIEMMANAESDEYGISSSPALNQGHKTLSYKFELDILNDKQFSYTEETHLKNGANEDVLVHIDRNAMTKLY